MQVLSICLFFSFCFPNLLFGYQYDLSVAAIFKDNAPYLKEWIEYHRMVGVEHFYLYDNSSSDNPLEVLDDYIKNEIVTLIPWPNLEQDEWGTELFAWVWTTQLPAYYHALKLAREETKWLSFIDTDEFITPVEGLDILSLLKKYKRYPGIYLYWEVYGTSNVYDIEPGQLMIELLTLKCQPQHSINQHTKVILKPKKLKSFLDPHRCTFKKGKKGLAIPREKMRLNHYINRTVKFFYEHKVRNKQLMDNTTWTEESVLQWSQLGNEVEDFTMQKFVDPLKIRMKFKL